MEEIKTPMLAARLRASILQEAVQGRLVPQDDSEGDAHGLLERIREERAELVRQKRAKAPKGGESRIWRGADGSWYEQRGEGEPACIDKEIPFDIPDSWCWARLGSIAIHQNGFAFKPSDWGTKGIPIVRIQNLSNESAPFNYASMDIDDCFKLINGDLLVSWSATLKSFIWMRGEAYLNQHIFKVYLFGGFEKLYYKLFMDYILPKMKGKTNGTTMHHLTKPVFENILIPIPSLAEQKRIVERLDELMPMVDGLESKESERQELDENLWRRLPQSILQEAVQGRLVPQDDSEGDARGLLERIREERAELVRQKRAKAPKGGESRIWRGADGSWYEQRGEGEPACIDKEIPFDIPDSWCWARFESLCDFGVCDNAELKDIPDGSWILDLEDLEKETGRVLQKKRKKAGDSGSTKHAFRSGMVLYSKLRPYLNKVTVADEDGFCTSEIIPLEFSMMNARYIMNLLMSPYFLAFANAHTSGIKMPRFRVKEGRSFLVPIPPLAEQGHIVERLDELMPMAEAR